MENDFSIPAGWVLDRSGNAPAMVGPEGDLTIWFVEREHSANVEEVARAAWKTVDPAFESKVLQQASMPADGNWEELYQIIYQVPAKESRIELAVVRKLGSRAFVNLVRGSTAAVSRRGAQLTEVIKSWKPSGYKEISLKDVAAPGWTDRQSGQLKDFVLAAMTEMQIPGVSIAVVQAGRVAYAEGFGTRGLVDTAPVTPNTRFMIGSATKPLTTLLMAKLVEQGKLSWSTPVVNLLDGFALADPATTERLELKHTASASTGMPRQDMEFVFRYSGITAEERIGQMKTMRPTTGFGETFQYSNFLVAAGGYAAARAFDSHSTLEIAYETALRELVFAPLRMNDSFLRQEDALRGEAALPHATNFQGNTAGIPLELEKGVASVAPAGGAWSTVLDMARYLMLELGKGQMPDGTRIISEDALLERRKKGVKIDANSSYGLGLFVSEDSGLDVIHHGGNTFGFSADMFFLPEKDLGVVVLTNLYAANGFLAAVRQRIFELMFGAELKAEKTVAASVKIRKDGIELLQKKVTTSAEWGSDLVGRYECSELGSGQITPRNEGFWMQFDEWGSSLGFEAEPGGDRLIRLLNPPWRGALKLLIDPENKNLSLDGGQSKYVFQKQS
jgi:CubicO group peptidase (beta-lactamase class C family)